MTSRYDPNEPAKRPGSRPQVAPRYRVLVHKRFMTHYGQLVDRVGLQQAQQLWDHLSQTPGQPSPIANITILKGTAGKPNGPGWSRTHHYEVTGSARVDCQYNDKFKTEPAGDEHRVVAILTVNYSSH